MPRLRHIPLDREGWLLFDPWELIGPRAEHGATCSGGYISERGGGVPIKHWMKVEAEPGFPSAANAFFWYVH